MKFSNDELSIIRDALEEYLQVETRPSQVSRARRALERIEGIQNGRRSRSIRHERVDRSERYGAFRLLDVLNLGAHRTSRRQGR